MKLLDVYKKDMKKVLLNEILEALTNGLNIEPTNGKQFSISSGSINLLSGINTGNDTMLYLFRSKLDEGVTLQSFTISLEGTTNDEYEVRISVMPEFSNYTPKDEDFSSVPISGVNNPITTGLEVAISGNGDVPNEPLISGNTSSVGGRLLYSKRARQNSDFQSKTLFKSYMPKDTLFCVSVIPSTNNLAVRTSISWNE